MKIVLSGLLAGALCLCPLMAQNTGTGSTKSGRTQQGKSGTADSTDSSQSSTDRSTSTRGRSSSAAGDQSSNSGDNTAGTKSKTKKKHKKGHDTQDQSGAATTR